MAPKQFEILHETMPKAAVLAMLENPTNPNAGTVRSEVQAAANAVGRELIIVTAVAERDIEPAFARRSAQRAGALLVRSDVLFNGRPNCWSPSPNSTRCPPFTRCGISPLPAG